MATDNDQHLPRWRVPVDVDDLRRYQTRAVKAAEKIMYRAFAEGDMDTALKANTRLTQAVQTYLKVIQAHDLEERITALEEAQERQQSNGTVFNRN
jgi:hypothetical protein